MKLPWVTDPAEIRRLGADVAIVGAPFDDAVSHRPGTRFGPRAIREAQYTLGQHPLAPAGHRAVRPPDRRRCRRRQHRAGLDRSRPRAHLSQGPRGRRDRRDPDHPRRRPLHHLARRDRDRRGPGAGQHRDRPLRRPCRHGDRQLWASWPATARRCAASSSRARSRARTSCRSACAATGRRRDVRLDAGAGDALALHARDRGARRRGRHRPGDR